MDAQHRSGALGRLMLASVLVLVACSDATSPGTAVRSTPDAPRLAIPPGPYTPGQSYFGRNGYIEYIAGDAPVILSAPHGGSLTPDEIPDRTASSCGGSATTTKDLNTIELTLSVQQKYHARYGAYPHVVINHLHRKKLDANRDIVEAACGDPEAEEAWREFHDFIDVAKSAVNAATGKGWYMDMHGHGHEIQRLELGYLLTGSQLRLADATLDGNAAYEDTASVNTMSRYDTSTTLSGVLRGAGALGTLYENNGIRAVPSAQDPYPESGEPYFSGGYNTRRHACGVEAGPLGGDPGGTICGVQIEANYTGVRDSQTNRDRFGDVTATILGPYLLDHWDLDLGGGGGGGGGGISLAATAYKVKGFQHVDLSWSGATTTDVDIYRDNGLLVTTANDGAYTDAIGSKGSGTYTYRVCEAGSSVCSNDATVTF